MVNRFYKIIKLILISSFFYSFIANASQSETDVFAKYIANNVFDLDKESLKKTANIHLLSNQKIRAFEIYENNQLFLSSYKEDEKLHYVSTLPEDILFLKKYISDIEFDGIYLGKLVVYYDERYIKELVLTKEEKDYLTKKKELTFCVDPNWMPYESIVDNEYVGIGSEYIKLFSKKLNIDFRLIKTTSWEESKQKAKNRFCDILPLSSNSQSRQSFMNVTKPHLVEAIVLTTKNNVSFITNLNELKGKKIGITNGYSIIKLFRENYPELEIVETKDLLTGLQMVLDEKLFGQIDAISTMNYYIRNNFPTKLKISSKLNETYKLGVASNKDDIILHNILVKLINTITNKEHNKIYYKWNSERIIVEKTNLKVLFQIIFIVTVIILFFIYWNRKLQKEVAQRTKELKQINESLEEKVKVEVGKNRINELKILEQSKLASLGDMIGHIAHQWRQPLSMISLASTGTLFQSQTGTLSKKDLEKQMNIINDNAQYLSNTIDTFRNFIKDSKDIVEINIHDNVQSTLNIIKATLQNSQIELKKNLNSELELKKVMPMGELAEVIINIINNAKDALIEKEIDEPWVEITIIEKNGNILIEIEDNAGGIPDNIINKIFEPYFSTKHHSKGTGLGLHMAYRIIVESLKGKIYVENTSNGAKFTIELKI